MKRIILSLAVITVLAIMCGCTDDSERKTPAQSRTGATMTGEGEIMELDGEPQPGYSEEIIL